MSVHLVVLYVSPNCQPTHTADQPDLTRFLSSSLLYPTPSLAIAFLPPPLSLFLSNCQGFCCSDVGAEDRTVFMSVNLLFFTVPKPFCYE